jgi:transposase
MHSHPMSRLTVVSREPLIHRHLEEGVPLRFLAAQAGISLRTAYKWLARYRADGPSALADRRSVRHRQRRTLDQRQLEQAIELRHQNDARSELKAEVKRLRQELDPQSFVQHPQVKLLAAVMEGIKERIAADPYASRFALTGPLRRYGRLKGLGLPDRSRLFFRPFEAGAGACC